VLFISVVLSVLYAIIKAPQRWEANHEEGETACCYHTG